MRIVFSGIGAGDTLKSVHDASNNARVYVAETTEAVPWTGVTGKPWRGMDASMLAIYTASKWVWIASVRMLPGSTPLTIMP